MVIILNPLAGGGKALNNWKKIEPHILNKSPETELFIMNGKMATGKFIGKKIRQGERKFIAAGGDGTVNLVLQILLTQKTEGQTTGLKLGAIGLGSSNDFHKPFKKERFLAGVPAKIDFSATAAQDAGRFLFKDEHGGQSERYWLNNASVGITAEANRFFNYPDALLSGLKKRSPNLAILYAALRTIFTYRNKTMQVRFGSSADRQIAVTNLGVVINPHFSGSFCYDSPYERNSGLFYLHLCYNMTLRQTLKTLWHLSQAEFSGLPNTVSFRLNRLSVQADQPFAVEFDGEIIVTCYAEFTIREKIIQVCQK